MNELQENVNIAVKLSADQDDQLIRNGYEPVPISDPSIERSGAGKAPFIEGWREGAITPERIAATREAYPDHPGTGLRTGRHVGIDIDIADNNHALKLCRLALATLGETPLMRAGSKGVMLCYRNETPCGKITTAASGDKVAKVEILGRGQQFVAYGIHATTKRPYQWSEDQDGLGSLDPLSVPLSNLPAVTPDQLRGFAAKVAGLFPALGYGPATVSGDTGEARAAPSNNTGDPVNEKVLREALSWLDPFVGRNEWRDMIAAIRAANIPGDDDLTIRRRIAHDWSAGALGEFTDLPAPNNLYTGPEVINQVFDTMPPKEGGIGVGTLFDDARAKGWQGNPFHGESAQEAFAGANLPAIIEPANEKATSVRIGATVFQRPADIDDPKWGRVQWHLALMAGSRPIDDIGLPAPEFYDDAKLLQKDPEGYVVLIQGKKGSMKTYVALSYLFKLAVEKGLRVSFFAGEGSYGVRTTRIQAIARGHGISMEEISKYWVTNRSAPNLFDDDSRLALMLLLEDQQPDIVVIDTLGQASPGQDLNSPGFGTALTQATKSIRQRFKCCLILIHHLGKNEKRGALGSTMIIADPGTILEVRGIAGHKNLREIWVHHVREGEADRSLGFRIQTHPSLQGVPAPVPMQISDAELLAAKTKLVPLNPDDGKFAELVARISTILQGHNIRDVDDGLFDDELARKLVEQHYDKALAEQLNITFLERPDRINDREFSKKEEKADNQEARYLADLEKAAGKPSRPGRAIRLTGVRRRRGGKQVYRCWYLPPTDDEIEEQSDD